MKLDNKEMKEVRLVGNKLPEEKINERKRKANQKLEASGQSMKEREKLTLEWNLMITNIGSDMLDAETIYELYRLRWVIELVFKGLKGSLDFDKLGNAGGSYFQCLFYGKMIVSLVTMNIFSLCNMAMFNICKRQVSIQAFIRNFRSISTYFFNAVLFSTQDFWCKFTNELLHISKKSLHEIRKRQTTEQRLMEKDLPEQILRTLKGLNT
jgi:Transposase DDE domain